MASLREGETQQQNIRNIVRLWEQSLKIITLQYDRHSPLIALCLFLIFFSQGPKTILLNFFLIYQRLSYNCIIIGRCCWSHFVVHKNIFMLFQNHTFNINKTFNGKNTTLISGIYFKFLFLLWISKCDLVYSTNSFFLNNFFLFFFFTSRNFPGDKTLSSPRIFFFFFFF